MFSIGFSGLKFNWVYMSKRNCIYHFPIFVLVSLLCACSTEEGDVTAPGIMSSNPSDGATSVDPATIITIQFTEKINLSSSAKIRLNDEVVSASAEHKELTVTANLHSDTEYSLVIPSDAIFDDAGNYTDGFSIHFKTAVSATADGTIYEAELAVLSGGASISNSFSGYSGSGYVASGDGNIAFTVIAKDTGYYTLSIRYNNSSKKINDLYIDGSKLVSMTFDATSDWKTLVMGKVMLTKGTHTISIIKNWGYSNYDYISLTYEPNGTGPFNIASKLVTQNPSDQAVKLYNYLKESFGTKVISGTMAAYSTNINEATWVHDQTGKWPAITCFDFIDHTYPNQNWIKYSAPFTLGQDWWNNNGIVALMWHWRDPLTKSGAFYTDQTTFDVSKVTDTTSVEYKAIIVDMDVIAGYLKQFRDANIPVIWRPLHEASGAWFWWGAKGAASCKALWILMFNRFTKINGLNNLIWVWTTDIDETALDWYPGDEYVDIIGMDIYPGENQHGSQYFSFNKVKDIFGGRKLITLSECGSVPNPVLMKEYGDMWSYFMPWNGDYTESDKHNGATWWKKFFNCNFVVTRDQMPSLK
jgi:mannan endo-1,4-beta-mannosidase